MIERELHVTMVNKYYSPPHLGGVETVVRTLSEGLVAHAGAGVRALVSNEDRRLVQEQIDGVEVIRLPRRLRLSSAPIAPGMLKALRAEARSASPNGPGECDILHLHSPYPWGELCFLAARPDLPSVVYYHSDIVRQKRMLAAYRPLLERLLDRVDLIMAASPNMIENSEFLSPRASKCRVVPYGLPLQGAMDAPAVRGRTAELRAQHQGRKIVLFVGRLVYYKGVDVLLQAMKGVDADLVLVGSGPLEGELRESAKDLGIAQTVHFLPTLPDHELHAWYKAADVFCLPSVARSEAFGLVQLEAHAAGTPVVSTDLATGVPYVNRDGETGLLVTPGDVTALRDGLVRLLADDVLRARLGHQAKARALRDFTVQRMVKDTLTVYREAMELHTSIAPATRRHRLGRSQRSRS